MIKIENEIVRRRASSSIDYRVNSRVYKQEYTVHLEDERCEGIARVVELSQVTIKHNVSPLWGKKGDESCHGV